MNAIIRTEYQNTDKRFTKAIDLKFLPREGDDFFIRGMELKGVGGDIDWEGKVHTVDWHLLPGGQMVPFLTVLMGIFYEDEGEADMMLKYGWIAEKTDHIFSPPGLAQIK